MPEFNEGIGSLINDAVTANNGMFQQLASAFESGKRLEGGHSVVRELPPADTIEGEFRELEDADEWLNDVRQTPKALPAPQTERQKRLKRYKRK